MPVNTFKLHHKEATTIIRMGNNKIELTKHVDIMSTVDTPEFFKGEVIEGKDKGHPVYLIDKHQRKQFLNNEGAYDFNQLFAAEKKEPSGIKLILNFRFHKKYKIIAPKGVEIVLLRERLFSYKYKFNNDRYVIVTVNKERNAAIVLNPFIYVLSGRCFFQIPKDQYNDKKSGSLKRKLDDVNNVESTHPSEMPPPKSRMI